LHWGFGLFSQVVVIERMIKNPMQGDTIDDDVVTIVMISSSASVCVMFVMIGQLLDDRIHHL
jgi:hypothetical protein